MKSINAKDLGYKEINEKLRESDRDITLSGCCGQRFIAAGMSDKNLVIEGVPERRLL